MELLLHPRNDAGAHRPDPRGRLSTVGHGAAFRALASVLAREGVRFMAIGGTFRDVAIRAGSTGDIDIVLVDCDALPNVAMREAGFVRTRSSKHAWRYTAGEREVEVQTAAVASSRGTRGPFSVAARHATTAMIEGIEVSVPRIEDYVILKLLAAASDRRRRGRDLTDVQFALESRPKERALSVPSIRGRMRDLYGIEGDQMRELIALFRTVPRPRRG